MSFLVPVAMFGWIPVVVMLFVWLPPRRAVLAAVLVAWLFLPEGTGYKIPMLPVYTKMTAATLGVLLGITIFDWQRLRGFRPGWIDLPLVLWSVGRVGASVTNGYGVYDGLSSAENVILTWGLPWVYGRLYFSDPKAMRELVHAVALGGLVYVPLCLLEVRMSPQLHRWVYGFHQSSSFAEAKRFGGFRPTVFMQHGLMVGMWMCMTGLMAWWLWLNTTIGRVWRVSSGWAAGAILATAIICKSFGAIALLALGTGALWSARSLRMMLPLWVVLALAPLYMSLRLTGAWLGQNLVEWSATAGNEERANSLQSRLDSEDQFINAGRQRLIFGFRGWYNTSGYAGGATPDALWMIEFTGAGLVGLTSLTLLVLWPPMRLLTRLSAKDLRDPAIAPAVALAMVCMLYMIDNLFNGMLNPVFVMGAGAVAGWKSVDARLAELRPLNRAIKSLQIISGVKQRP